MNNLFFTKKVQLRRWVAHFLLKTSGLTFSKKSTNGFEGFWRGGGQCGLVYRTRGPLLLPPLPPLFLKISGSE